MHLDASPAAAADVAAVVSRFLDAACAATIPACAVWSADVSLDATCPGWRFHRRGVEAVRGTYTDWFSEPGELLELTRDPVAGGEVVRYLISSTEGGEPYVAHHVHRLQVRDGLIHADTVFCGGRWPPERQAEMRAADEAGRG